MSFPNAFQKNGMGRFMPSGAGGWTPASLGAGLVGWYKVDQVSSLWQDSARTTPVTAANDPIGAWDDLSGNGNHLVQATSTKRPIYTADYFGTGKFGIVGDGTDDALGNALVLDAVWSAAFVGRNDRAAGNANRIWTPRPGTDTAAGMTGAGSGTPFWAWFSNQAAGVTDLFATKLKGRFILVRESDTVMRYRLDGSTTGTFDPSNNAPATGMAVLASTSAGAQAFLGGIGELVVVNAALSAANELLLSAYLESRWS